MNILQVATLNRPIGLQSRYSPIEAVIYNIDRGLSGLRHHSIVACPADSVVFGEHCITIAKAFTEYWSENKKEQRDEMKKHLLISLERAIRGDIDIIHLHDATMLEYIFRGVVTGPVPIVMTLHVPVEEEAAFRKWNKYLKPSAGVFFVPISEYQRKQHEGLINLQEVIHHGIDIDDYPFLDSDDREEYFFSLGRITRDKGQDRAIEIAKRSGLQLIIAGNVQNKEKDRLFFSEISESIDLFADLSTVPVDKDYFSRVMKPILDSGKQIIYIGELSDDQKKQWLVHARAMLFPIQWGEPFGLVLIESMACGTPVIALNRGSVPEIVVHGETGFVVNTIDEIVSLTDSISAIDPRTCRRHVADHFSIDVMARKYSRLYHRIRN
ncbi:MAG: hypothetical protein CVV45_06360 [Spirochaetae bacterium HGW-Spirochaetae-10]|nr:MAG: hypothetical protein CVV45_06360 [Spirochaetae bacterium HGW-Spirochaetae-10]